MSAPQCGEFLERKDPSGKIIGDDSNVLNNQKRKVEAMPSRIYLGDEIESYDQVEDGVPLDNRVHKMGNGSYSSNIMKELMDARILLEAMKSQQASLVEELQYVRQENDRLVETLSNNNKAETHPMLNHESHISENGWLENPNLPSETEDSTHQSMTDLQVKLDKMIRQLEDVGSLIIVGIVYQICLSGDEDVPENILVECCCESPSGVTEQTSALLFEGGSKYSSSNQELEEQDRDLISLSGGRKAHLFLKKQVNMAYEAFIKLHVKLAAVFKDRIWISP